MADQNDQSWRSNAFRQKVIAQIEEAIWQSGSPTPKTSQEMENHVYEKAHSKDEYLGLVARLILHLRELSSKNKQGPPTHPGLGSMPPSGVGVPDPINALQNLARQKGNNQQMANPMGGPNQMPMMVGMNAQNNAMQGQQGPPQQPGQPFGPGMQHMVIPSGMTGNLQLQQIQRGMRQPQQQQQQQQQPTTQQMQHPGKPSTPQMQMQASQLSEALMHQGPGNASHQRQDNSQSQYLAQSPHPIPNHMAANPSPQHAPSNIAVSPAGYAPSPSPQIVPSPLGNTSSQSNNRTPGPISSAPSPNSSLNTPSGGLGAAASPAGRNLNDDQVYLDKVKQLSKFIDPLRRMITRYDKDEEKKREMSKMKNLLDILSDPTKRVPMDTLLKCEQVLEKLDFKNKPSDGSIGIPLFPPGHTKEQSICLPLLEAITAHIKSPMLNHTLQRTFGPAMASLHGPPIKCPSPPPAAKRRKVDDDANDIPDALQGEIARLDQRFKVSLDPIQHSGSRTVHLICQLDDKNLPCVPPITITVPENYPQQIPQCDTSSEEYDSTPFLQAVQVALSTRLTKMPEKFSVTSLLDTWEMSVRQACAPRPTVSSTTK